MKAPVSGSFFGSATGVFAIGLLILKKETAMKKIITVFLSFVLLLALVSCSAKDGELAPSDASGGSFADASDMGGASGAMAGAETGEPTAPGDGATDGDTPVKPTLPAGQLTAAEWRDLNHFEDWLALFRSGQTEGENGAFYSYVAEGGNTLWMLPYRGLVTVEVKNGETPCTGAHVTLEWGESSRYAAVTDARGLAYLFTDGEEGTLTVKSGAGSYSGAWAGESLVSVTLDQNEEKQSVMEIMFVIDTTGSMSDELRYIQAEIDDVIGRVKEANADATVRLALLFYRDQGDEYVTRYFDFTEDLAAVKANLAVQTASGGGDYPEAVHTALSEAVAKQWSSGATTKLLFHILDAPPHSDGQVAETYRSAILTAAEKGIRIIPVASSGVNKMTEYLLREEALLTGGTYTFLTNDSGIGGDHLTPTVGEYTVEYLNAMLVRLICEYYTGVATPPVHWQQQQG